MVTVDHKQQAYLRIIVSTAEDAKQDNTNHWNKNRSKKMVHALFHLLSMMDQKSEKEPESYLQFYFWATDLCKKLTPNEFQELFPITKWYKGNRYQLKDYFSVKEVIQEIGADTPLGENVAKFLWDYEHLVINVAVCNSMTAMSSVRRSQGKKDMIEIFFGLCKFKEDITTEIIRDKLEASINGFEWLVLHTTVTDELKRLLTEAEIEYDGLDGFLERAKKSIHATAKDAVDMFNIRDLLTHAALMRERKYEDYCKLLDWLFDEKSGCGKDEIYS